MKSLLRKLSRGAQVTGAFWRIDFIKAMNYPLALFMKGLSAFIPVFTFAFVAELVSRNGPDVANDYYTFVVIGVVTVSILAATLNSFGNDMLELVTQGQLEMFLVEPVRWNLLPFAMTPWAAFQASITSALMILLSIPLGAEYRLESVPIAILIIFLGLASTLAIGILGASIKILSKRADPVLSLYALAASVLSGVFFPIELLPAWLRTLAWAIPHTYVIQALRRVLMPDGAVLPGPSAWQAIAALSLFCLVLYPIAIWVFDRSLEYGRKIGALSGY